MILLLFQATLGPVTVSVTLDFPFVQFSRTVASDVVALISPGSTIAADAVTLSRSVGFDTATLGNAFATPAVAFTRIVTADLVTLDDGS